MYRRKENRPVKTHVTLEPRLSMVWKASPILSIKAGYSRTSQTTLLASSYDTDNGIWILGTNIAYLGHIRHAGLRQNFRILTGRHEINAGLQTMLTDVKSAEWQRVTNHEKEQRKAWDNALWANWQYELSERLAFSAGLRLTAFSALGGPFYYDID